MDTVIAAKLKGSTDEYGLPENSSWHSAVPVTFCADWRGENPDPERQTEVRILWSESRIFLRYECRFREIFTYEGTGRHRDRLWLRDVAEIFIRPGDWDSNHYLEFEISPNGDWLDLDIVRPEKKAILYCDMKSRVKLDRERRIWTAELGLPVHCFQPKIDPAEEWRLNLFRIEGPEGRRFYSAWIPTRTRQPNFHVPELFGALQFRM